MKGGKQRIAVVLVAVALAGTVVWVALDPGARSKAHDLYHRGLVLLKLTSPETEGAAFWCPMHPEIRRPTQGTCPICSMALVPLKGETIARETGILELTTRQVQQAGVRTALVEQRDLVREIDATARLDVNPERHRKITSWVPGRSRIERLHYHFTGEAIRKGEVMVELYSPVLVSSIEDLRLASRTYGTIREDGAPEAVRSARRLVESARERLLRFGLSAEQSREIAERPATQSTIPTIPIRAPLSGTLIQPAGVKEGGFVEEGQVLFHLADLSSLWLFIDIYEYELPFVSAGQEVEVSTRAHPGRTFGGEIRRVEPLVQESTRTVRLHVVVDNEDGELSPGMFARVRLHSVLSERLAVPESAVLQSGRRNVVIVSEGDGRYRPEVVKVGLRYLYAHSAGGEPERGTGLAQGERYHEVLSGLAPGERVVVAGNFLLNAEAQFQGVLEKMLEAADSADRAARIPAEAGRRLDEFLDGYLRLRAALAADLPEGLTAPARDTRRLAGEAKARLPEGGLGRLRGILNRSKRAAEGLAATEDLEEAREHFASLSREVIAYLRDFAPGRVAEGELHVFRCPMADDAQYHFGFDLWVQKEPDLENPYMGQRMPG